MRYEAKIFVSVFFVKSDELSRQSTTSLCASTRRKVDKSTHLSTKVALKRRSSMLTSAFSAPAEHSRSAQLSFNFQQPVVLADAFTTARRSGLNLSAAHGHAEISHEVILSLA